MIIALAVPATRAAADTGGAAQFENSGVGRHSPFVRQGMWIWYLDQSQGGYLPAIVATAHHHHIGTVYIKSGDGTTYWEQFNGALVADLHRAGLKVCAWQFVYGNKPAAEARIGARAVEAGADCLVIDAEAQYEGKYAAADLYISRLRAAIGAGFPLSLAGFPYVDYHPAFPYSVFLGPGAGRPSRPASPRGRGAGSRCASSAATRRATGRCRAGGTGRRRRRPSGVRSARRAGRGRSPASIPKSNTRCCGWGRKATSSSGRRSGS